MDTPTKKQITEEAPRENEQNSRVLIDQSPIALEFFNRAGLLIRVNPACLQLFGITDISEIYKFSLFSDPNLSAERKRAIKHGQSIRYEAPFDFEKVKELKLYQTTKSGQIWLDISITPTKDDVGSISGYILQIQDITARKAAEKELQDIIDNNPMSIQIVDKKGFTLLINQSHTKLFGAVPPPDYSIFTDPQLLKQGFGKFFESLKKGEKVDLPDTQYNVHDIDPAAPDVTVWVHVVAFSLKDASGQPERFVFMHEDISERKKMGDDLKVEKEKYQMIFSNIHDQIVYVDRLGKIINVNNKVEKIFGYKPAEVVGNKFASLGIFEGEALVKLAQRFKEAVKTGTGTGYIELEGKHKDGHNVYVEVSTSIVKNQGKMEGFVAALRDITETKKQQSAIKELGDFLQNTINSVADPLFVKDDHYRFVIANDALCKMLGMERKDILGKTLGESLPADQMKHFLAIDKAVLDSGQSDTSEEELTGKDKAVLTIITKKTRYVDKNGQRFLVGVVRDVTERKKMENRAAVAVRYRQLFETTQDGILLVDYATGKILDVNLYMIEMLGYSKSNMVRKYLWEISELAGAVASKKEFRELKKKARVHFQDLVLQTKTGKKMAVECIATTYEVNGERIIQYNIRDINARKRAELVLSNLMNRDQAILESIGDVVFATDKDQNILLFNWAAEQITGISDQQAIGRHYRQIFNMIQEKDGQPIVDIIGQALRDDKIVDPMLPTLLVRKDGQNTPITVLAAPVEDGQGKIIGAVVVIHDITKEHQIDKVKSEFVSLASHQLRTPTTAIKWYAEVLAGEEIGELNAKQKKYINEISHGNQRMIDLMDSLLGVSRIELGTMRAKAKPLRLDEVADDVLREAQPIIDGKKIVVEKKYELGAGNIVSDQALIRIVLQNVLSNAATYTAAKGKITVAIAATAVGARLTITDNGCGVPPAALSELGRKFFRADNASIVNPDGTGLGLYVAISMAKKVGGTVEIKSKEGVGTKVLIDLPNLGRSKNTTKPTGSV